MTEEPRRGRDCFARDPGRGRNAVAIRPKIAKLEQAL